MRALTSAGATITQWQPLGGGPYCASGYAWRPLSELVHATMDLTEMKDRPPTSALTALRLKVSAEAFQGLADVRGMLVFDGNSLRLDFQTEDALFGMLRSGPKQLSVPLASIEAVRSRLGWFWLMPYIEIELNDFTLLSQVPGAHDGRWRLRVPWRDRHALKRFASALAFARSGDLHQRLTAGLDAGPVVGPIPQPPVMTEAQRTPPRQLED